LAYEPSNRAPDIPDQTFYRFSGGWACEVTAPFVLKVIFTIRASVERIGVRLNAPNHRSNGGGLLEHSLHDCGGTDAMRFIL